MTSGDQRTWRRFVEGTSLEGQILTASGYEVVVVTARGPSKDVGEDAAGVFELSHRGLVLGVVDGMGGHSHGLEAARTTVDALGHVLAAPASVTADSASVAERIQAALLRANAMVAAERHGGGATCACVAITEDELRTVHSGDAEVLVISTQGAVKVRTVSHSPVGMAQEAGLLSEDEALLHPDRHLVSNGVGVPGMSVHVGGITPLAEGDTIILASDGITDNARQGEIVEALRCGRLDRGVDALVALCHDRMERACRALTADGELGKPDDLTLVAARRIPDELSEPAAE